MIILKFRFFNTRAQSQGRRSQKRSPRLYSILNIGYILSYHKIVVEINFRQGHASAKSPELFGKGVQGNPPAGVPGVSPGFPPFPKR